MASKNQEIKQRKRQAKLARRKQKQAREAQLIRREKAAAISTYSGKRYNQEPFVEALFHAEIGIFEADVCMEGRLTDAGVRQALEYTIRGMRQGQLTLNHWQIGEEDGLDKNSLIVWGIGNRWRLLFEDQPGHSRNDLIGILRRIMYSIDVWTSKHSGGRGYLKYIAGQMSKLGVSCMSIPEAEAKKLSIAVD